MIGERASFDLTCECGELYHAEATHLGGYIRCRKCGKIIQVRDTSNVPAVPSKESRTPAPTSTAARKPQAKVVRARSGKKLIWAAACLLVILVGLSSWYVHKRWNQDVEEGGQAAGKVEPPLPAGYSEAPAQTPERHDIFDDVDKGAAPQAIPERSASKRHNRRIDPGVDVVLPVGDSVDLLETPDVNAAVVVTASSSDPLPVLQDGHVTGWFHALHLRSGKTGWVSAEQVQLSKTKHPLPAPQFAEEFTGSDQPPSILIRNQTAYELTVTIRDASYTVRPHSERQISESPGKARFQAYVAAPDVIPAGGTKEWSVGYKYDWAFWIERTSRGR